MQHAANASEGKMMNRPGDTTPEGGWDKRWSNHEEYATTHADNGYRSETGAPLRDDYSHLP